MAMPDRLGRRKREVKYYPYDANHSIIGSGSAVDAGAHTGGPVQQEASTFGLVGLLLGTAGDMVNLWTPVPRDLNILHPCGVRVHYLTGSGTSADTIDWIVLYTIIAEGTAMSVGATALDTAISQDTVTGTANAVEISPRGVINGATFTEAQITGPAWISWNVEMDAFAAGLTEDKIYLGLLFDYVPKRWQGPWPNYNAALADEGIAGS